MTDYSNLKNTLSDLLKEAKAKKAQESEERKQQNERDRVSILNLVGKDLGEALKPYINEIRESSKISSQELSRIIIDAIKIDTPQVDTDSIRGAIYDAISQVRVPTPQVNYTPPAINVPAIKMPEEMDIKGWVQLQGVDLGHPLPVQLRDKDGRVVNLFEGLTTAIGGGGGGGFKVNKISDIANSAWANLINSDGRLRMSADTASTGLTDTEL